MDNGITQRLFDKIEELKNEVHQVAKDLIEVKGAQTRHYELNERDHINLTGELAGMKETISALNSKIDSLEEGHHEQQAVLEQRKGVRKVFGGMWQFLLALAGSGAILGGLGWLVKHFIDK